LPPCVAHALLQRCGCYRRHRKLSCFQLFLLEVILGTSPLKCSMRGPSWVAQNIEAFPGIIRIIVLIRVIIIIIIILIIISSY
jgi:hypothetical protein